MGKYKSVICVIVKNEQRYIKEWVEHNITVGFDKLFIYEDYGSDSHQQELQDYIGNGLVELVSLDKTKVVPMQRKGTILQQKLFNYFFDRCRKENIADWIGFFDVDEFIMFEDGWNLESLEEAFKDKGGVLLSWKLYGANGHIKRPEGKVVDNYTTSMPEGSKIGFILQTEWNIKSLCNVRLCGKQRAIHVFDGCVMTDGSDFRDSGLVFEKAWLNHYFSKSWEDYLDRIFSRGNMHNNYRCLDNFFQTNPDMLPLKEKLINEQRYRHCQSTMWISHDLKIISGGNVDEWKRINGYK